jgi:uncharacterized protein (DUF433 family)
MIPLAAQVVPIKIDNAEVIRVGNTRVRLETVIYAFNEGHTAEEIVSQYPALKLADVYAVLAYYLNNQADVDEYLEQRATAAAKTRQEIEAKPEYKLFRDRLLARRQQQSNS